VTLPTLALWLAGGRTLPAVVPASVAECCWLWTKARHVRGYGAIARGRKMFLAHRVVFEWYVGPIPAGLELDHACRQRGCVNPAHLRICTTAENQRFPGARTFVAQQLARTHCPRGHAYDAVNTYEWRGQRLCKQCRRERWVIAGRRRRQQKRGRAA
jgi:hypothetical protein